MTQKATLSNAIQNAIDEALLTVGTSIPGYILNFDPDTQLAEVQIGIKRLNKDGEEFSPPPVIRVPVCFSGGSFCVEHQVDIGDEGLIIFSQRCIDAWIDQGGIAPNPILRKHDITDGIFIPGIRSQVNKISDFQNNGIRIRNKDGDKYVWLKNDGDIDIKGTNVNIESDTLSHNGTNIGDDHGHPYTWTDPAGSGTTGGPQ